jgi:GWxTD domain-containing protein
MSRRARIACVLLLAGAMLPAAERIPATWRAWLADVRPIMTRAERETFALFRTEEDRARFREAFWRVRDPDPATPGNEFQKEYERSLALVRSAYGGAHSDRGRIYLLLGKPSTVNRYSGEHDLVECEVWGYTGLSRRGLPPFLNFLFYRPRDMGDFRQFYPGMQGIADLLTPTAAARAARPLAAYQLLRSVSPELADASLSLIPGEGNANQPASASSSSTVMARVQELPERDVPDGYLREFAAGGGAVRVSDSSRRVLGWGDIAAHEQGGLWFISWAMLPDRVEFRRKSEQSYLAEIAVYLTVEDAAGRAVYRAEKATRLDVTGQRRREIEEKKVVFRDLCPVVPGRYRVQATWINKDSGDFFSVGRDLEAGPRAPELLAGFQLAPARGRFLPFASEGRVLLSDPRLLFARSDRLVARVAGADAPTAVLVDAAGKEALALSAQENGGQWFAGDLSAVADGSYALVARDGDREIARRTVHVMPGYMELKRPFSHERSDDEGARPSYQAVLAEQLLNLGRPAEALARLEAVPAASRTPAMTSLLAMACYRAGEHARVLELLAGNDDARTYAELTLLANSAIELKRYDQAAATLERLRRYGDTAAVNHLLAAAWTVLGDNDRARQYHERAVRIETAVEPRGEP